MDLLSKAQRMLWKRELSAFKFEFLAALENNPPSEISKDIEQLVELRKQLSSSDDIVLTDRGMKKYDNAYTNILSHVKSYSEQEGTKDHSLHDTINSSLSGFNLLYSAGCIFTLLIVLIGFVFFVTLSSQFNLVIIGLIGYVLWQMIAIARTRISYLGDLARSKTQFSVKYIQELLWLLFSAVSSITIAVLILSKKFHLITTDDGAIIGLTLVAIVTLWSKKYINKEQQAFRWLCGKDQL
ncbi:MAG: hypothetical protein HRU22_15020 [Gammaproteobacteria bacterium]|nr:hypothetical protein [Gammaproteobacteria bacterium]